VSYLVFASAHSVSAQEQGRPTSVGVLIPGSQEAYSRYLTQFVEGLTQFGYFENKNLVLHVRWADGNLSRLPALAEELVQRNVDVLVVSSAGAAIAAHNATIKIPIVQASGGDPIMSGVTATYAHPQGNVTGISNMAEELSQKSLEKLLLMAPNVRRIGVTVNPDNPAHTQRMAEIRRASEIRHIQAVPLTMALSDLDRTFDDVLRNDIGAAIVLSDGTFLTNRRKIIEQVAKVRIPTIYQIREFVFDGGLMSYGINIGANYRQAASLVDQILKGTKPADIPVQRATKYELVINLKTAQALSLTVPRLLLASADSVIE
jgi:putative ABC transport system substrate-binding protein